MSKTVTREVRRGAFASVRRLRGVAAMVGVGSCLALMNPAVAVSAQELSTSETEPTVLETGRHEVTLSSDGDENYFEMTRTMDKSSLWFGFTNQTTEPDPMTFTASAEGADSKSECGSGIYASNEFKASSLVASGVFNDSEGSCLDEEKLLGSLRPTGDPKGENTLVIWEEPPVEDRSLLPPQSDEVEWSGQEQPDKGDPKLGSSFTDATELEPGKYTTSLDVGNAGFGRIDLDWGEHLEVSMKLISGDADDGGNVYLSPVLWSPLGGVVEWGGVVDEGLTLEDLIIDGDTTRDTMAASPMITWRNREAPLNSPAAFPGTYYLTFGFWSADDLPQTLTAKYEFSIEVVKDDTIESPYTETAAAVPTLGDHGGEPEAGDGDSDSASGSDSGGGTPWGGVVALLGGSAVFTAGGAVLLGRHRRLVG